MKISMVDCIYTIPKGVRYIIMENAFSELALERSKVDIKSLERESILRDIKIHYKSYVYIGYEEVRRGYLGHIVEVYWFIHQLDLNKCIYDYE